MTILSRLFGPRTGKIIIDGVCFEWKGYYGIPRVWTSLFEEWSGTAFGQSLIVLDRNGTAPKFKDIEYIRCGSYQESFAARESFLIENLCRRVNARLFVSTNHTTPVETPSALMVHDLIPERWNFDKHQPWIREKVFSTYHATAYMVISQFSADELKEEYPFTSSRPVCITHNGISSVFQPQKADITEAFKRVHGIQRPYFICVGARDHHKNVASLLRAFAKLENRNELTIVLCGGRQDLEAELAILAEGLDVRLLALTDSQLCAAYSGAIALVLPSLYEGFGLPLIEAMASGCPVIAHRRSAIPEIAADAALYLDHTDVDTMRNALIRIQKGEVRVPLIEAGLQRAKSFSWKSTAERLARFLASTALSPPPTSMASSYKLWRKLRLHQQKGDLTEAEMKQLTTQYFNAASAASSASQAHSCRNLDVNMLG